MTQLEYSQFYRQHGVRKIDQLTRPPLTRLSLFDFPKLSLLHFLGPQDGTIVGPANDEYLFRRITRPIVLTNVTEMKSLKGPIVKRTVQVQQLIRHYLQSHRRYRVASDLTPFENAPSTTAVVNYGFMSFPYKYRPSVLTHYYEWYNAAFTLFNQVGALASTSRRNQFIHLKLPHTLPSVSDLRQASTAINQTTLRKLHEPDNFLILEFWKWLSEDRSSSMLDQIPSQNYDRVNFIFEESGRYTVLNLGILNQLRRRAKGDETEPPNGYLTGALPSVQIQRRFLQFLMLVHQQRSVDNKVTAVVPDDAKKAEEDPKPVNQDPRRIAQTTETGKDQSLIVNPADHSDDVLNQDHSNDIVDHFALSAEMEQLVQKNLEALEEISDRVYLLRRQQAAHIEEEDTLDEPEHGTEDKTLYTVGLTPSGLKRPLKETETAAVIEVEPHAIHHNYRQGIMTHLTRLSDQGLISPNEVKRYEKLASAYASIPAPDHATTKPTTLDKFVVVDPADIKIAEAPKIPDRRTIFDKSMLENSLEVFDAKYLKHTLQKDIAAMVLNLQHAGIAVTEYESTLEESNMGDRYNYRVRLTPIQGTASTIHFDIPAVDETGVYVVNGTQYRLRKQRSDLPIRKVGTDEVILSSYYGKLFVRRDEKRVNDYGAWITRAIMDKGFDQSNQVVTAFHPNNVFDHSLPAPRLFTILAQNFSNFDVSPLKFPEELSGRLLHFVLDHRKHAELRKSQQLLVKLPNTEIMIGYSNKNELISVDLENRLRLYVGNRPILLPTLEEMIGLDSLQAPVDIVVAKIKAKNIPVGFILAYYMGFQKLIESLGVTPRRVPARGRLNLEPHEYTIAFADETLIFSRKDSFASLLLAGMTEYHRSLKSYSVHEFDHPGVYLNVLSSAGLSAHHLREMDLLRDLFLDPITREKLIEMKEPHEFIPLVLKAVQLLTTDNHPRVTDGSYRHIKGYERLAGILYGQLVDSVRKHRGRIGQSKQPIDLHPYAVWQAISEDTSKSLVKDINPIENLKQMEAVTATGSGGVAGRMMAKINRIYDKNDMGVISESTVDSADTAVNTFLSATPIFDSVRGTANRYEEGKTGTASVFSTSSLSSPASDRDDKHVVLY